MNGSVSSSVLRAGELSCELCGHGDDDALMMMNVNDRELLMARFESMMIVAPSSDVPVRADWRSSTPELMNYLRLAGD